MSLTDRALLATFRAIRGALLVVAIGGAVVAELAFTARALAHQWKLCRVCGWQRDASVIDADGRCVVCRDQGRSE